jgi:hypothetical protein
MEYIVLSNLQRQVAPPSADNVLINGTNKNANGGGQYNQVKITKGKKYRLRLINTSLDNYLRVSLDNHQFQVITADFVPVTPFYTSWILIAIGQRHDVIITANQTAGNYWFRVEPASECRYTNKFYGRAIWTYDSVPVATPTTLPASFVSECIEPVPSPYWKQPVPSSTFSSATNTTLNVGLTNAQVLPGGDTMVVWALNYTSINVAWEMPTLSYAMSGNYSFPGRYNVIPTLSSGKWNYWLIVSLHSSYDRLPKQSSSYKTPEVPCNRVTNHDATIATSRSHPTDPSPYPSPRPRLLRPRTRHLSLRPQHHKAQLENSASSGHRKRVRQRLAGAGFRLE